MPTAPKKTKKTAEAEAAVEPIKKYELLQDDTVTDFMGRKLFRIRALKTIVGVVMAGALGGYVQSEENLAQVSGNAWVYGNAQVYGNARVSPIHIQALTWPVTIADTQMVIGCQAHTLAEWDAFGDREIIAMDGREALRFWQAHKVLLLGLARANGREWEAPAAVPIAAEVQ